MTDNDNKSIIRLLMLPVIRVLARLVLEMLLFVLNGRLGNDRYMCDLNCPKGVSLSIDFWLSWCRPKPRNE